MLSEELFRAPLLIITCKKGQTHEGGEGGVGWGREEGKEGRGIARGQSNSLIFVQKLFLRHVDYLLSCLALFLLHGKERRSSSGSYSIRKCVPSKPTQVS